jgi:cholesterol transport system auxiliary component
VKKLAQLINRLFAGRPIFAPCKIGIPCIAVGRVLTRHSEDVGLKPDLQTNKTTQLFTLLIASFALTGCVGEILQSKVDEPQTYVLQVNDAGTAKVAYPLQLGVALPKASPGLDTNRIAVLRNANQLDYYFGARWGGTAPQVVQAYLVSLLQAQQGFKGVNAEGARVDADYLLDVELKDFQAAYASANGNPTIKVTLVGTLIQVKTRQAVASVTTTASTPASDNRLGAVVTAFQTATRQASLNLSEQLAASLSTTK